MGYMVELNTLLGLNGDFDTSSLEIGQIYRITKARERAFPLHLAVLMVDSEWNFYGYAKVNSILVKEENTEFEFEVLSLFNEEESDFYKERFIEAAKKSGEIK
jgi:hypothetical protein